MTAFSSLKLPLAQVAVFRRPAGGDPASAAGWELSPELRCDQVTQQTGPGVGCAELTYVSFNTVIEDVLRNYTFEDEIWIALYPIVDELVDQSQMPVLFYGYLGRARFEAQGGDAGSGDSGGDRVRFTALPLATYHNRLMDSVLYGRWIANPTSTGAVTDHFRVFTPTVPVCFNFRGKPNRHAQAFITSTADAGATLNGPLFTHDDDPQAKFWTVREAIASMLAYQLLHLSAARRYLAIDPALIVALNTAESSSPRTALYQGFDDVMPETMVHGMGLLDALEAVCRAAGFVMSIDPDPSKTRPYVLRIFRKGTADSAAASLYMDKRWTTYETAEQANAKNNISKFFGMIDSAETANTIGVVRRRFLVTRFDLKPLWSPTDIKLATSTAPGSTVTVNHQGTDAVDATGDYYAGRHLPGGAYFEKYGHVFRAWGLDCVGAFTGYPWSTGGSEYYAQDPAGTNFPTVLGIVESWTRRVRKALPLPKTYLIKNNLKEPYLLEVSENAGSTWSACPVAFKPLDDNFGIWLDVSNFADLNVAAIKEDLLPCFPVSASWLALLLGTTRNLRFRLTCMIESDYPGIAQALPQVVQGGLASLKLFQLLPVDGDEILAGSADAGGFTFLDERQKKDLQVIADRRRAATSTPKVIATASQFRMHQTYRLGQTIKGVSGRNFTISQGDLTLHPNIVRIVYRLGPNAQSIELSLDDERLVK